MASQKQETVFDLGALLRDINRSFTEAALELRSALEGEEWQDQPFTYVMPKMHVSIRLELSHSDGTVKGVFRRLSTDRREELASTIEVDLVSIPKGA